MNDSELKRIATELAAGKIMTSYDLPKEDGHLLMSVFAPLNFYHIPQGGAVIYGRMENALDRKVKGYPMFHTISFLTLGEWKRVKRFQRCLTTSQ